MDRPARHRAGGHPSEAAYSRRRFHSTHGQEVARMMKTYTAQAAINLKLTFRDRTLLIFVALGAIAFRSIGLIVASVVNSMQESQIVIQLLYFPMLFLSGTTIPISVMPNWVQMVAQFIPATYLMTGMQSILGPKKES